MTNWNRASVEAELFSHWRAWREEGRLDGVLPGCGDQEWMRDEARVGYRTVDYRTHRDLRVPDAPNALDLVEIYWSVRTRNGVQDPDWPPALNVNLVAVTDGTVTLRDVERLYRDALALRGALMLAGMGRLSGRRSGVSLYVRGVLVGPDSEEGALLGDALSAFAEVPIAVAHARLEDGQEPVVKRAAGTAHFFDLASADVDALRDTGAALVGSDRLFRSEGVWAPEER